MSILASRVTKSIPIPFELRADGTPHEATIQKLSGKQLQRASAAPNEDRLTALVRAGLKTWTVDAPLTPETIDDLDGEALNHFATEIMRLTKPALFQTTEEAEAEQKNG